jgi:hypothetical protein
MKPRDIFISHAEEDGEIALGLARALREKGQPHGSTRRMLFPAFLT